MKRRSFINNFASSFAFTYLPSSVFGANQRLQIASIGVGGKGRSDSDQLGRHGEIIALCDVDQKRLQFAAQQNKRVQKFSDFRELITFLGDRIDVLSISTPDHSHALAAQMSLECGIHVFVQSPLVHTVWESRQLRKLAKEKKLCTQMGIQGTAQDSFREAVEFLQAGRLGEIKEIHVWTNKPSWPQAPMIVDQPQEKNRVPDHLNWSCFLAGSSIRAYHSCYHPYNWRGWLDFGSGALGDSGSHLINLPLMGCDLPSPQKVQCLHRGPVNPHTYPAWATVRYEFELNEKSAIPLIWYEGRVGHLGDKLRGKTNHPPTDLFSGIAIPSSGSLLVGSKGMLLTRGEYGTNWYLNQGKGWNDYSSLPRTNPVLPRNGRGDSGMKDELVRAVKLGRPDLCVANFDYSARLAEICQLGNVAILEGNEIEWNPQEMKTGSASSDRRLSKAYRRGWEVKEV